MGETYHLKMNMYSLLDLIGRIYCYVIATAKGKTLITHKAKPLAHSRTVIYKKKKKKNGKTFMSKIIIPQEVFQKIIYIYSVT